LTSNYSTKGTCTLSSTVHDQILIKEDLYMLLKLN